MRIFLTALLIFIYSVIPAREITKNNEQLPVTCPETWKIDNLDYVTLGTWIINREYFSVKILVEGDIKPDLETAKKIAAYSYKNGYFSNSQKLNRFNSSFHISKTIKITFIDEDKYDEISGIPEYSFIFKTDEFKIRPAIIKVPFSLIRLRNLESQLKNLYNNHNFEGLYNILSIDAKSRITFDQMKKSAGYLKDAVLSVESVKYTDNLYKGSREGIKGFDLLFQVKYHNRLLNKKTFGKIIVTIIEGKDGYEIYGTKFLLE